MMFWTGGDPARKYYGAGRISHPAEWNETITYLENQGVKVSFSGKDMAYGVSAVRGQPGNLRIDADASISALRHEKFHFEHDKRLGFPGARYFFESYEKRWYSEFWAYIVELKFAREQKNAALAREILDEMRSARKILREFYVFSENKSRR
ncbi:MAG TPA: hypothetical protein VK892_17060 [Pyrinomonadaceae bacterium]|nr:hypothetical protein [Pyrinomonadaceae bacterium]